MLSLQNKLTKAAGDSSRLSGAPLQGNTPFCHPEFISGSRFEIPDRVRNDKQGEIAAPQYGSQW